LKDVKIVYIGIGRENKRLIMLIAYISFVTSCKTIIIRIRILNQIE